MRKEFSAPKGVKGVSGVEFLKKTQHGWKGKGQDG
jgi:hypothetical protein